MAAGRLLAAGPSIAALNSVRATFDDEPLVADGGLILVATVVERLEPESLVDTTVRLVSLTDEGR